ncbi:MAG: hypothetical protein ACREDV_00345, partial [Methylocella sp.]
FLMRFLMRFFMRFFMRFLGLGLEDAVPGAKTLRLYREALTKAPRRRKRAPNGAARRGNKRAAGAKPPPRRERRPSMTFAAFKRRILRGPHMRLLVSGIALLRKEPCRCYNLEQSGTLPLNYIIRPYPEKRPSIKHSSTV